MIVIIVGMTIAHSRVTAQGQISVPAEVRRKLGVGPGSVLEWDQEGGRIVVRRSGRYSSEEVHRALFGNRRPRKRRMEDLKEAVRHRIRAEYARG